MIGIKTPNSSQWKLATTNYSYYSNNKLRKCSPLTQVILDPKKYLREHYFPFNSLQKGYQKEHYLKSVSRIFLFCPCRKADVIIVWLYCIIILLSFSDRDQTYTTRSGGLGCAGNFQQILHRTVCARTHMDSKHIFTFKEM